MTDVPAPHTRYHAFDALRAAMMLLGVVLHACQFYLDKPLTPEFDFRDTRTSVGCSVAFFSIHAFRMQVFFVMAGFFAALLADRRGMRGMWSNRLRRVGLPLVVFWPILFLPVMTAVVYGCARHAGYPGWTSVLGWLRTGGFPWVEEWKPIYNLFLISPLHLWFLYALMWFYLGTFAVGWIGRRGDGAVARGTHRLFRGLADRHLLLPASIALSTLTVLPHPLGFFAQEFPLFIPNPLALVAFGPFFGFGWMLFRNAELLPRLGRRPLLTLAAVAAVLVYYLSLLGSAAWPRAADSPAILDRAGRLGDRLAERLRLHRPVPAVLRPPQPGPAVRLRLGLLGLPGPPAAGLLASGPAVRPAPAGPGEGGDRPGRGRALAPGQL